jgi:hypothetical protein
MFPVACYWKLDGRKQYRYNTIFHKGYDSNKCDDEIGRDALDNNN